ncbi:MAG: NAD(P)H-hydrate dehydratase [Bdellovibrionales bacterium]
MIRLATSQESLAIDRLTQEKYGISSRDLMDRAGHDISQALLKNEKNNLKRGLCLILCGPGNNGGDGHIVAQYLRKAHIQAVEVSDEIAFKKIQKQWSKVTLIVDALFGVGLNRDINGWYKKAILQTNQRRKKNKNLRVISVDMPSGLNANTGQLMGAAICADRTYALGRMKPGFFLRQGPEHTGRISFLPLQFPKAAIEEVAQSTYLFSRKDFNKLLPPRLASANKSHHGKAVIVAGSTGKWGAALLATRAAFRIGAGYVICSSFESPVEVLQSSPEIMTLDPLVLADFLAKNSTRVGMAIGPGLGFSEKTAHWLEKMIELAPQQVILDADALTICAEKKLTSLPPTWVLTPHSGELARLMETSATTIESDPLFWTEKATQKMGCHVLLKGYHSILGVRSEEGCKCLIIPTGNAALAKAGSGDVLSGLIAGLMSQGLPAWMATAMAAYLHGAIADRWLKEGNDIASLLTSELLELLPETLYQLRLGPT